MAGLGSWSADDLPRVDTAEELEIATRRADGTLRGWVPIWVVRVGDEVYVRTWHRRDTGWFGQVVAVPRALIRVPGTELDVVVEDVGGGTPEVRTKIDAAYAAKYGRYGEATVARMVSADAVAATLRLVPATA